MEETKHREDLLFFTDLSGASPNVSRVVRLQRLLSSITCKWLGAEQHCLRKVFCLVLDHQTPSGPNSRYDLKHYANKVSAVLLGFSPYSPHIWSSLSPQSQCEAPHLYLIGLRHKLTLWSGLRKGKCK